jgi:hypothetical protein
MAAVAMARARRKVKAYFFAMHAIAADEAVPYKPGGHVEARQFEWMKAKGIIHEAGPDLYWIDTEALADDDERRRRILVPVTIIVSLAIAGILLLFYR